MRIFRNTRWPISYGWTVGLFIALVLGPLTLVACYCFTEACLACLP